MCAQSSIGTSRCCPETEGYIYQTQLRMWEMVSILIIIIRNREWFLNRLIFAPADKVDAIWSKIASKPDLSLSVHLLLNPPSIARLWPPCFNLRISDKSGNITGEWDPTPSTRHLSLYPKCLRQRFCYRCWYRCRFLQFRALILWAGHESALEKPRCQSQWRKIGSIYRSGQVSNWIIESPVMISASAFRTR